MKTLYFGGPILTMSDPLYVQAVMVEGGNILAAGSLDRLVSFSDLNSSHWAFYPIMEASNSHDHIKAGGSEQWTGINN